MNRRTVVTCQLGAQWTVTSPAQDIAPGLEGIAADGVVDGVTVFWGEIAGNKGGVFFSRELGRGGGGGGDHGECKQGRPLHNDDDAAAVKNSYHYNNLSNTNPLLFYFSI